MSFIAWAQECPRFNNDNWYCPNGRNVSLRRSGTVKTLNHGISRRQIPRLKKKLRDRGVLENSEKNRENPKFFLIFFKVFQIFVENFKSFRLNFSGFCTRNFSRFSYPDPRDLWIFSGVSRFSKLAQNKKSRS